MPQPVLIAIVDDDRALRDALAELLAVFDLDCRTYDGAPAFLDAYAKGLFGCVITDLNMVGMSGMALLQQLQREDPELPVILISAQINAETKARALRAGALAYLNKPIDDVVLHRHIVSALTRRT